MSGFIWMIARLDEFFISVKRPVSSSASGPRLIVQNIYGSVMRERELLHWAHEGIRRLDRAQTLGPSAERGYEAGRVSPGSQSIGFSDEDIGSRAMYGSSRAISFSRNSIAFT
jgi:hypothetical protein